MRNSMPLYKNPPAIPRMKINNPAHLDIFNSELDMAAEELLAEVEKTRRNVKRLTISLILITLTVITLIIIL